MDRRGDKLWLGATIAGFLMLAGTLALRWKLGHEGLSDTVYSIGLVLGSGLIAPNFIIEMIQKYKGGTLPPPPPATT